MGVSGTSQLETCQGASLSAESENIVNVLTENLL